MDTGTSVTYNPVSDGHESATIWLWIGDTRYVTFGVRGNVKFDVTAQGIPYLMFEFTGLFKVPAEQIRVTPTLTAFQEPQIVSDANTPTFTMDGTAFVMRSCMFDLGNQIGPRFLVGSEGIRITDKAEAIEMQLEAVPLTTFDPFTLAAEQSAVPMILTHGTGAGRIATLSAPRMQMQRPQGLENADDIKEWKLRGVPLPDAGNDQWTLTLT